MTDIPPRVVVVTPRVRAVIGELALDGADDIAIAQRLGISPGTVKTHMKVALRAVGVNNRTALVCSLLRGQVRIRVKDNRERQP